MASAWFVVAIALLAALAIIGAISRARRAHAIRTLPFPPGLRTKLASRFRDYTPLQLEEVLRGLRDWFHVVDRAKRRFVAMPSRSVDEAWHEFILFTQAYGVFCRRTLGRFLHHVPAEAMRTQTQAQEGLRRTWRLACAIEGIDPRKPKRLPRLFALDGALAIPAGFIYALDCGATGRNAGDAPYCASHIGCASGCGGSSSGDSHSSDAGHTGDSGGDGGGSSCGGGGGCGGGGD